ncbi:hypothetical protein, partial [Vibrio parahaemolyticus]|uniref:hypothetical protein n=1 Tax=Vibrio parahaemolyticus TaxID=670 RepID=UPI001C60C20F
MDNLLIGIVCGLIGYLIGHRFALGRDLRKEHNDLVIPIREKLLKELDQLNSGTFGNSLSSDDLFSLVARLPN